MKLEVGWANMFDLRIHLKKSWDCVDSFQYLNQHWAVFLGLGILLFFANLLQSAKLPFASWDAICILCLYVHLINPRPQISPFSAFFSFALCFLEPLPLAVLSSLLKPCFLFEMGS